MARRDNRRRSNRANITSTKERTRLIDGGTSSYYAGHSDVPNHEFGDGTDRGYSQGYRGPRKITTPDGQEGVATWNPKRFGAVVKNWEVNISQDNPDKRVTDTVTTSRMQSLDKRSSDDNSQEKRNLKTKKQGKNKLRIQLSGDGSSSRLRDSPNSGRKRNKLKIDVQGSGGNTGVNVPR